MVSRSILLIGFALACATDAGAAVNISSAATENMACADGVCSPTAKKATLNVGDLAALLAGGDVRVTTGNGAITIVVTAPLTWSSVSRLTLDADYNISIKAPVTVAGSGGMTLSPNGGGSDGDLQFFPRGKIDFRDTASSLVIGGDTYALVSNPILPKSGHYALAGDYDFNTAPKNHGAINSRFFGTFEGLGHTVANFIEKGKGKKAGLFLQLTPSGIVRDLVLSNVFVGGQYWAGTAVAWNYGTVIGVSAHGDARAIHAGGLVSLNYGRVSRSQFVGTVSRRNTGRELAEGGGIAASSSGVISRSFANATVENAGHGGGLVGTNCGTVSDSFALGAGTGSTVGGLLGTNCGQVSTSYAIGPVAGGTAGGLIGADGAAAGSIQNTYWDLDTSGIDDPGQGAGNVQNDPGIVGLTDPALKSALPANFDPAVWGQDPGINEGYPYLLDVLPD